MAQPRCTKPPPRAAHCLCATSSLAASQSLQYTSHLPGCSVNFQFAALSPSAHAAAAPSQPPPLSIGKPAAKAHPGTQLDWGGRGHWASSCAPHPAACLHRCIGSWVTSQVHQHLRFTRDLLVRDDGVWVSPSAAPRQGRGGTAACCTAIGMGTSTVYQLA
jgi:hypothetical protein